MPKKPKNNLDNYIQKFEECRKKLNKTSFILTGSITKHYTQCQTPGCHCMKNPQELHGPYYNWTRKVQGKTVTVRLTKEEAKTLLEWTDNKKQFYKLVKKMEQITLDAVKEIRV